MLCSLSATGFLVVRLSDSGALRAISLETIGSFGKSDWYAKACSDRAEMSSSSSAFSLLQESQARRIRFQLPASVPFGTNRLATTCSLVSTFVAEKLQPQYAHVRFLRIVGCFGLCFSTRAHGAAEREPAT